MNLDNQELIDVLRTIGFSIPEETSSLKEIQKYLEIQEYGMGKPIILADEIPKYVFI